MADSPRYIVAVGMFDGLHRGHAFVLRELCREAAARGLRPKVLTFSDHPIATLAPERAPRLIMPAECKAALITSAFGISDVALTDFSPRFASMTGREFLEKLRHDHRADCIAMGFNNHIGSDRLDARAASALGIIDVVPLPALPEGECLCSSAVREAIAEADFDAASRILGHSFDLCGTVVEGNKLGRTIGYPTANISPSCGSRQMLPPDGVYAADAFTAPDKETHRAIVNIGVRPTVDKSGQNRTIEAHILDFDADLYGTELRLEFITRLRDEKKFESLDELRRQLDSDAESARRVQEG